LKTEARLLSFLCIVVIAGLIALYIVAVSVETVNTPLSELDPSLAGSKISTQGLLLAVSSSGQGGWLTLGSPSTSNTLEIHVKWIENGNDFVPGSRWAVEGELLSEKGRYMMFLPDTSFLTLLESPGETVIPLDTLCKAPRFYEGMSISVEGDVTSIYKYTNHSMAHIEKNIDGDFFSLRCIRFGTEEIIGGKDVTLHGVFQYDPTRASYRLIII